MKKTKPLAVVKVVYDIEHRRAFTAGLYQYDWIVHETEMRNVPGCFGDAACDFLRRLAEKSIALHLRYFPGSTTELGPGTVFKFHQTDEGFLSVTSHCQGETHLP